MAGEREPTIPPIPPEPGPPDQPPQPETGPVLPSTPEAALGQARARFIEAEKALDREEKRGQTFRGGEKGAYEEASAVYGRASYEYESHRAEAVGASVEKMLEERERMVEAEIAANPRKVGYLERQWRAWGERSLIPKSWREKFDQTDFGQTRVGQVFIRSLNMRTALSLSLWGVAVGSGFGSVVGIGSLIARSGIGAAGTYFGSQALMEGIAQKRRFTVNQKKLKEIESFDFADTSPAGLLVRESNSDFLEGELARLEAASLLAGKRPGDLPEYQRVREAYLRYVRTETEERPEEKRELLLASVSRWLDKESEIAEANYRHAVRSRKILAAGLAALFPAARIGALILEGEAAAAARVAELKAGMNVRRPLEAVSVVPVKPASLRILSGGPITESAPPRSPVPVETPRPKVESASGASPAGPDSKLIQLSPDSAARVQEAAGVKTAATAEALATAEKGLGPVMAIEQGGNIWKSAMRLVETGAVSKADFEKAWSTSLVEIEGQGKVPIHKVGLVHPGDKIRFIAGEAGGRPRIEVIPESKMPVGSDKDLFAAYQKLGKEAPEWLKKSVGAPVEPAEALAAAELPTPQLDVTGGRVAQGSGSEYDTLRAGEEAMGLARREAKAAVGGSVLGGGETAEGVISSVPEIARAELVESLKHFDGANLADQEAMIAALARRAGENPLARELIAGLEKNPRFLANLEAHHELLVRLNVQDSYPTIRDMTLIEIATRSVQAERILEAQGLTEATAEMDETSRAAMRIARLIKAVNPDGAGLAMTVDTFLKVAPQRFLEIVSSRS